MNRSWILHHLEEAQEALQALIRDIKADNEFNFSDYLIDMEHLYNHLNTAWNSRDVDERHVRESVEEDFYRWRKFPADIHL